MTHEESVKLQKVQMEIMDVIHELCLEHNIRYYMVGGTILGAVRHQGFIPWDIDIDIAMYREDYIRFKEVCQKHLKKGYRYCDHTTEKRYFRPHALVCKENTELQAKYDKDNPRYDDLGIYIDVFPIDNAPDDETLREKQIKRIARAEKLRKFRVPYVYSRSKLRKAAFKVIMACLYWYPEKKVYDKYHSILQTYNNTETDKVCSMVSKYSYHKELMDRAMYGTPLLMKFEDREYYGPEMYDEYLTQVYGDYMKFPPEEERQANLDIFTHVKF